MSGDISSYPVYHLADFTVGMIKQDRAQVMSDAIEKFTALTGDDHPLHSNAEYARQRGFEKELCHGLLISSYVSRFIAYHFLGSKGLLVSFNARYLRPIYVGVELTLAGKVESISLSTGIMNVGWSIATPTGERVQFGQAGCLHEPLKK